LDAVISKLKDFEAILPSVDVTLVDRQYVAVRRALLDDFHRTIGECGDEWFVFKTATEMLDLVFACVHKPQQDFVGSQAWAMLAQSKLLESSSSNFGSTNGVFHKPMPPRDMHLARSIRVVEADMVAQAGGVTGVETRALQVVAPAFTPAAAPPAMSVASAPASPFTMAQGQFPMMMFPPFMPYGFDGGNMMGGGKSGGRGRGRGRGGPAGRGGAASSVTGAGQPADGGRAAKRHERDATRAGSYADAKRQAHVE
jgi:hypothetical protein